MRVRGLGLRVESFEFRVLVKGFRVRGSGFGVECLGSRF